MTAPAGGAPATSRLGAVEGLRALSRRGSWLPTTCIVHSWSPPRTVEGAGALWIERLGPFGVSIFFVLSGSCCTGRTRSRRSSRGRGRDRSVLRAAIRADPSRVLAGTRRVGGDVDHTGRHESRRRLHLSRARRRTTGPGICSVGIDVAWTLVIEVSFYLVLPGRRAAAGRKVHSRRCGSGASTRRARWARRDRDRRTSVVVVVRAASAARSWVRSSRGAR